MGGIMPTGEFRRDLHKSCRNELQAFSFKSRDNLTSQMPLYAIRLDND
jgi:hypothetical protein